MKRIISILVVLTMLLSVTSVAFAMDGPAGNGNSDFGKKHEFQNWKAGLSKEQLAELRGRAPKDRIRVNGKFMDYDVPPVIKEGRTLIPVRAVTRGLGADVDWDEKTKTVTIIRDDVTIVIKIDSLEFYVNGVKQEMDIPAQLICNRTFVPLRFIAEALGDRVNYDPDTGDIDINRRLATPERPTLVDCIAEWEAVDHENNGYRLRLFHESDMIVSIKVEHGSLLEYDFSDEMEDPGCYTVRVTALAEGEYSNSRESKPSEAQIVDYCLEMERIEGSIITLDGVKKEVVISYMENNTVMNKTVTVTDSTLLKIDDADAAFFELKLGDKVLAVLHHDVLIRLEVE